MLLRRGARIAGRVAGRSLVAVHVVALRRHGRHLRREIEKQRLLAENLGGSLQLVVGDDIAATVLEFARTVNGTQIVVGASRHGRFAQLCGRARPTRSSADPATSTSTWSPTRGARAAGSRFAPPRIGRQRPWPWAGARC